MQDARSSGGDRSLGDLLKDLVQEVTTLVRQELTLAKTEMTQKAATVGKNVAFLAAGGAIAYAGLLAILAAVIIMLANIMPWWLSALLVGLLVAGVGAFLVFKGIQNLKNADLAPRQTIESLEALKEDVNGPNRVRNRAARPS